MIGKYGAMPATDRDQCGWDRELLGTLCTMDGLNRVDRSKPEGRLVWQIMLEANLLYEDAVAMHDGERYRTAHRLYMLVIMYTTYHQIPFWSENNAI